MTINMMCMNNKCKYYFEDNCMRNINEERIELDEDGKCETFEVGRSDLYKISKNVHHATNKQTIITMYEELEYDIEEIAEKLGDVECIVDFDGEINHPSWCGEDADCHECWKQYVKKEIDKHVKK